MSRSKYYAGIDWMRLACAVLVIAIHTSPLASFTETGDFILTRVVARVAVPFFLMTTGYFTLARYRRDNGRLLGFLKKTGLVYFTSIALCLPLNIYGGYFAQPHLLPNILKDLVFDGTLYHLWYLPASMLGMLISWRLVQGLGYRKGLAVAFALYIVGLLGDSYYGLAARLPALRRFYDMLFELFDYTRNGIFFAPVFLMLGGYMADRKPRFAPAETYAGCALSLALMLVEAMLLRAAGFQRHSSMYVFLLPSMVFLFRAVLRFKGRRVRGLRTAALLIYIIHPLMIVAVRAVAKVAYLQRLLVEQSLVHFAAVCSASVLFSLAAGALWERRAGHRRPRAETERAYIELSLAHLKHNAAALRAALPPGCELMAVVKARAYGHDDYAVATCLEREGVKAFAVATIDEGIRLRRYGIQGEILILGFTDARRARELRRHRLKQTLIDRAYADQLNRQGIPVRVHIGIDSGMHRLGLACNDYEGVKSVFGMRHLKVEGMFTHLCCCDSLRPEDVAFTQEQIRRFYALVDRLEVDGLSVSKLHIQSSYGLLNYPGLRCDYVRAGIALYGVASAPASPTNLRLDLRPVLALKAKVILIRDVPKGEYVGYGRAFQAARNSRIAILPLGYADGLPRSLSCGRASVRIGGRLVPIIGRVCMDQLAIDITDAPDVAVGDTATLIDNQKSGPLLAPDVAEQSESISNELLSRMGARLPVIVKD